MEGSGSKRYILIIFISIAVIAAVILLKSDMVRFSIEGTDSKNTIDKGLSKEEQGSDPDKMVQIDGVVMEIPDGFAVGDRSEHSITLAKDVIKLGQGATSFIYLSVVPEELADTTGSVYNYDKDLMDFLDELRTGEIGKLPGVTDELKEWTTYERLDDIEINGIRAKAFVNEKPWEFPEGTKEIRYILSGKDGTIYLIGAYIGGDSRDPYYFPDSTFELFVKRLTIE